MSTPTTPVDPSPPPSAGGHKRRGPPSIPKLVLPRDAEQWLSTEFARNPKPTGQDTARWLAQIQRWTPEYTLPHLTQWIKGKRVTATRLKNSAEKQRIAAEAQMESQVFPQMTDTMKNTLRGFYTFEQQPSQALIETWAAAMSIPPSEVARWIKWKHAMDETMRAKSSNTSLPEPKATSGSSKPIVTATPLPPRVPQVASTPVHPQHAIASSSLVGPPNIAQHGLLPRPQHQVALPYKPPHAQPPPSMHGVQTRPIYPVPYPPSSTHPHQRSASVHKGPDGFVGHPGTVPSQYVLPRAASGPVPLPPKPPDASRRQPSIPPIAILERGTPQAYPSAGAEAETSSTGLRRQRHVPSISTGSAFPGPSRPKFLFPHQPQSPVEQKPDVSMLLRPSTAPTHERRRSHSPARLSPTHRRDERPLRRQSPPPSVASSPGQIFRYSPGAGSPSASTSAPSVAAGRPPGESEPPPSPSPPPTGTRGAARYSPATSEASTSRTITSGPLAPFFTELASALHEAGIHSAYPFDTSDLSISVRAPARRLSTDGILRQLPRSNHVDATPTPTSPSSATVQSRYNDWFSSFSTGEKRISEPERYNAEIEARNAEMLRDLHSGGFAHLGLGSVDAPLRGQTPVVKREPEI